MMIMMGLMWIVPLLLLGCVIYALGWRPQSNRYGLNNTIHTPAEILKARFAKGDISRDEYDQMRRDLEV